MSNLNLDRTNLGDITGVLDDHGAVSDLSWMDLSSLENPEENYPGDSQREIIPQLEEQWSHDKAAVKTSSLIMNCGSVNTAATKADKKVSDEEINSVIITSIQGLIILSRYNPATVTIVMPLIRSAYTMTFFLCIPSTSTPANGCRSTVGI